MALVLTGNLSLGTVLSGSDTEIDAGLIDVSAEVTSFKISAKVDTVEVPATMTTPIHGRGGANDFSVTIGYLSNDIAGSLFDTLWQAIANGTKALLFEGSLRSGAIGADNPVWQGVFIVTEATVGAAAEALSTGSATFPLIGAPSMGSTEPA